MNFDNINSFTAKVFGCISLNAVLDDVIADYLFTRAVLLTTPTVANVGMSLTIPIAIASDLLSGLYYNTETQIKSLTIGGAVLVVAGFILVNTDLVAVAEYLTDKYSASRDNYDIDGNLVEYAGNRNSASSVGSRGSSQASIRNFIPFSNTNNATKLTYQDNCSDVFPMGSLPEGVSDSKATGNPGSGYSQLNSTR